MMVLEEEVADIGHTIAATGLGGITSTGVIGITIGVDCGAENRRKMIETVLEFPGNGSKCVPEMCHKTLEYR